MDADTADAIMPVLSVASAQMLGGATKHCKPVRGRGFMIGGYLNRQ